ncbi:MAG: response regulator, partial [Gammaproteobacteria bacterium]
MKVAEFGLSSIRAQIIIGGLLPLLLVAAIFSVLVGSIGLRDKQESIESQAGLIVDNLAQAGEYYLFSGDQDVLQELVAGALESKWVGSVAIVDQNYRVMARQGVSALSTGIPEYIDRWIGAGKRPSLLTGTHHEFNRYGSEAEMYFVREIGTSSFDIPAGLYESNAQDAAAAADVLGWVVLGVDSDEVGLANREIIVRSVWVFLIGLLFSLLISLYLARRLLKPINAVTDTIHHIAEGDLSARVGSFGKGEIVRLIANVNSMAEIIESSQKDLQRRVDDATASLVNKVGELEQRNRELDTARQEAYEAEKVKASFLANMSHEIRTPVNAIYGFSQRILKSGRESEKKEYVEMMSRAAKLLIHLIDGILGFSQAESGSIRLKESVFDIRLSLENIATIFGLEAQEKGLELVALIDSDVPEFIRGDELRIEQVLANLLANAIKFTQSGHVILKASVDADHRHLTISVIDTGIGISHEEMASLFNAFHQSDSTFTRNFGGVGLGLAICRHLTALMGASVSVKSEPGQGSEFYFSLPLDVYMPPALPVESPLARYNILVFEPHPMVRHSLKNMLVIQGITVFTAQTPEAAGRILKGGLPGGRTIDAVIVGLSPRSDLDEDNRERLTAVRADFSGPMLVLATGRQSEIDLLGSVRGEALVLVKPARSDRVMSRLGELLGFQRALLPSTSEDRFNAGFLRGLKVLVAEDNEFNRRLIESWLIDWGATVILARDGEEVLDRVANHQVDFILLDLHMPKVDGVSALKRLRSLDDPLSRELPVIVVTADVFGAKACIDENFASVDIVYKPINPDVLGETMARMLGLEIRDPAPRGRAPGQVIPDKLRPRLKRELGSLGTSLKDALNAGQTNEVADLLHQIHGITGYFQMETLEQVVNRCRRAFKT